MADAALVPSIWPLEIANAVRRLELQRRFSGDQAGAVVRTLGALEVAVHDVDLARALGGVLDIARTFGLSVYDASYLELAIREWVPLATIGGRLRRAAIEAGVEVLD